MMAPSQSAGHSGHNASVDALRGIAAAMIVFFHLDQFGFHTFPREWLVLGALGVNLFFTLSGFLIGRAVLQPREFDRKKYFRNRALRILPNYFICCLLMMFIVEARTVAHSTPAHLAFDIGMHAILMHGWFDGVSTSFIGVLWTLSHEWIFYLLIGVAATQMRSARGWAVPLGMLLVAVVAKQLLVHGIWLPSTGRFNPLCYWDQFAMGIIGAQLSLTKGNWKRRTLWVWMAALGGMLFLGWCVHRQYSAANALNIAHINSDKVISVKAFVIEFTNAFYKRKSNVVWYPCVFAVGISLVLVSVTAGFERLNMWISKTPLIWLGKVSYSTYLYHGAVGLCLMRGFRQIPEGGLFSNPGAAVVVALIGVYSISAFCFHFFEKPWLTRKSEPRFSS